MGIVHLVGAGPGDPDLVTIRAIQLLKRCDVVVYDNLIPDELVVSLPPSIEKQYVGKRAGRHSMSQDKINGLLVELASQGKRVVRLKGGDPFMFGRGGEEARFLKQHSVPFEIVPGVTSGVAAPAYVGIPCTDRQKSSFVIFVSGHKATGRNPGSIPWDWLGKVKEGSLVIYMGVSEIQKIVTRLLEAGMAPDTPAAAIERGTFPTYRSWSGPISQLPEKVRELDLKPPVVFIIGEVVKLQKTLAWLQDKPLFGRRVLVTRSAEQARPLYNTLRDLGAEVLPYPTIATTDNFDKSGWKTIKGMDSTERWLVFTSENGVRYFLKQWVSVIGDVRELAPYRIAAVGAGTARALRRHHLSADFVPVVANAAALAQELKENFDLDGAAVVRVRGDLADDRVEQGLRQVGAEVTPITVYQTKSVIWPEESKEKLFAHPPDVILISSGSAARGLKDNLTDSELKALTDPTTIVSIGPSTSNVIRSCGMTVNLEARDHTIPSMIEELQDNLEKIGGRKL